ncbi:DNA (cytosine-5)-methyltransferase 1 [Enterococcus sp. PF1-24]|uniref:DNA (cytosine-5-)-methyltransferase n=1 Tax=unclassified Enterococcus TaxID=2608891 RepID=UPI00247648FD|nr:MULTISPECIES: DNA (cytosine-5-)-methyltransferase [unclassified Enterococcus]MDH6364533.1 DNA (cytosine-5)-methyltransferase 1 [Enterococcus sp. PFB1-1]MDH6401590.1 DNA (cytosine-5)-methyltransferase 1 [Enterococcus sp. PF1-24]
MSQESLTFLDLFSGIGGFRFGMEAAGHVCKGFCEINENARRSYCSIHDTKNEVEMHDITTISDEFIRSIGSTDVICGGFPCQAFSIAGRRRGFEDTRGTLFFEIARFASILKPKYLFLENVRGLLSHDHGNTFETIIRTLDDLGYGVEWQVHNSKDYLPQNRERIFIIGRSRTECTKQIFPFIREENATDEESGKIKLAGTTHVKNDLSSSTRERTYFTDGIVGAVTATDHKSAKQIVVGNSNPSNRGMGGVVYHSDGISPTLTTNHGEGNKIAIPVLSPDRVNVRQNGRRLKGNQEEMFTLTAQDRHGIIVAGKLDGKYRSTQSVIDPEGISPTLTTMSGGGQEPKILIQEATKKGYTEAYPGDCINLSYPGSDYRRGRVGKGFAHTLLASSHQGIVTEDFEIRKLTPMECWRLQGFPDWAFMAAKFGSKKIAFEIIEKGWDHYHCDFEQKMSDSQLYMQAGNSVTIPVIYDIAKRL